MTEALAQAPRTASATHRRLRLDLLEGWGAWLTLLAAAFVIWAPSLLVDFGLGDSVDDNLIWSTQFAQLVAHGHLYPRWLPGSFEGLGSPAFYFYPPVPFWTTTAVTAVFGAVASPMMVLKLAALAALFVSGVTMRLWLRSFCEPPKALLCALIYMVGPYHLIDHYVRGAFAEFFALSFMPLCALGLLRTARGERSGPLILAAGYGLMICSHLPMSLLTSTLLIAPYGLYLFLGLGKGRTGFALKSGAALGLGVGLAATYLVPALTLEAAISSENLWRFQPADSFFTSMDFANDPFGAILVGVALAETAIALALAWSAWTQGERRPLFWAGVCAVVLVLVSGFAPAFWSLPLMAKVQFAWRAQGVLEFAFVTVLGLAPWPTPRRLAILLAALVLSNPGTTEAGRDLATGRLAADRLAPGYVEALMRAPLDAPEYLPEGMLKVIGKRPAPRVPFETLTALPLASPARWAVADPVTGAVSLAPTGPGPITLRRFYFPSWRITCDGAPETAFAATPGRLVGFSAPAGARRCEAAPSATPQERVGDLLSAAALAALLAYAAAVSVFTRRRAAAPTP